MASTDGHEAWTELAAARIDLVITDREMPAMNGLELLRAVRQSPRHGGVPVIMLTGTTLESAGDEADAEGASAFYDEAGELARAARDRRAAAPRHDRPGQGVTPIPDAGVCLQERYAPALACFGCGPANPAGLHVRSVVGEDGAVIAHLASGPHHEAFPGVLNGGIIGTLLDCHCNWAAAHALMRRHGADCPPCTVTADYAIRMRRPTPTSADVHLRAWVVEIDDDRATVDSELTAGGEVTATCRGRFVAVKPGHPAYHRW